MLKIEALKIQTSTPPAGILVDSVGNTPLLRLSRITSGLSHRIELFAKAEWFNPGGSVKDRPALSILRTALEEGRLEGGKRLLDSTSGNMGIAYASFGAALGIPVTLAVPSSASRERIIALRALGAELILTDPLEGSDGAIRVARRMAAEAPDLYFYANQYDNPANWMAHYQTTGPEIVQQTRGRLTHFIAGLGTTGTLTGTGRYLRQYNPAIQIIAVEPDSPFHGIEGLKYIPTAIRPGIYDETVAEQTVRVSTEEANDMTRRLAREEGLFVGVSSGAAVAAALKLAAHLDEGILVMIFPDSGYKYLSDKFWEG